MHILNLTIITAVAVYTVYDRYIEDNLLKQWECSHKTKEWWFISIIQSYKKQNTIYLFHLHIDNLSES